MKGNTDKCYLIVSTDEPIEIRVGESLIKSSSCEKLLCIKIDNKLNFDTHVKGLCTKANNKLRALTRATPYMSLEKKEASHEFLLYCTVSLLFFNLDPTQSKQQ